MLYKKNNAKTLSPELFQNPSAEYRGAPFWAWNCELDQKELNWQLECLKKMGFGGAHMHVRTGMATPYLSDEYMELIKGTVRKAKEENMLAWLYDEDRWPSGAAGGLVTREDRYRNRFLLFTPTPYNPNGYKLETEAEQSLSIGVRMENGRLLACYDVHLDPDGGLLDWRIIGQEEEARYDKWYAYLEIAPKYPWYNNQSYVNTLDKAAMDRFIQVTYERYNGCIPEEFDKTVPAIFTDEPQFSFKAVLKYATEKADVTIPWTDDLPQTYAAAYGEDLLAGLPELFWDYADGHVSQIRYHYHDHVCERFVNAFADNCGKWCEDHGLMLTGHMVEEPTLESQTAAIGEAMRSYRGFQLPGVDMLCASLEYTTVKQTQSAARQFGREGVASELYGVTNWDFDLRGHKLHGDWQAALGVTVRVPHLSWVSMAGEAKRDYPASINYQSPWWEKYAYCEDHFARVNTAMTRGKALCRVGVIHPIESYWLHWGPAEQTALIRDDMDRNFQNLTKWLLFGGIDFDFICESLLPQQCREGSAPLQVGEMAYDVILVPGCETLRSTTLERLEAFRRAGGKLVFAGSLPTLADACPSSRGKALAEDSLCIPFAQTRILECLEENREIEIRDQRGKLTENLLHQLREDGSGRWLFIAHGTEPYNKDIPTFQDLRIRVKGRYKVTIYDTVTADITPVAATVTGGVTQIRHRLYDYDSLLLRFEETEEAEQLPAAVQTQAPGRELRIPGEVPYTLSEPNALLLDQAEFALDNEPWQPLEEVLRLDDILREKLDLPNRKVPIAQPWVVPRETPTHVAHLRFAVRSAIALDSVTLAIEDLENSTVLWNGQAVSNTPEGWYVDKSIKTVSLGALHIGENILEVTAPFGRHTNLEWAYILGDFGVEILGRSARIVAKPEKLAFGDFTRQGLPFYGGNVTYHIPVETTGGSLSIRSSRYRGFMQCLALDGGEEMPIAYPPYTLETGALAAGQHTLNMTLYGHRRNSFGPVHLADLVRNWIGPDAWRSVGEAWSYEYNICEEGILAAPVIREEAQG